MTNFQPKQAVRRGLGRIAPVTWRYRARPSLVILTYHRVLPNGHPDRMVEQPGMWVSPESFAMHLKELSKHFEFVDLANWLKRSRSGNVLPALSCAITFDDGWSDNYRYAFPLIRQAQVPATVFLVSDFVGGRYSFWPTRLARLLGRLNVEALQSLPTPLLDVIGEVFARKNGKALSIDVGQIDRAIDACKVVPDAVMRELMDRAEASTDGGASEVYCDILGIDEIVEMQKSRLISFGSHTRQHTRLRKGLSAQALDDEISGSQLRLEEILGQKVDLFCYPNGDYTDESIKLVRECYAGAVTTAPGWNQLATDPCRLHRITLHEGIASNRLSLLCRLGGLA